MAAKPELKVSVFSDYICPFCYIGSRRLLRLSDCYDLKINWCGLEIHPDTPAEGMPVTALGYAPPQWNALMENLTRLAAAEGLQICERTFTTNSRRALLLAEAAKQAGTEVFYRLHEALFDAFFRQGRNIGEVEVLRGIAAASGVPTAVVDDAWREPRYGERLQLNLRHAAELGVTGTPTYVFGRRLLAGAVEEQRLRDAARQALEPNAT